jgi:hypothetical protein
MSRSSWWWSVKKVLSCVVSTQVTSSLVFCCFPSLYTGFLTHPSLFVSVSVSVSVDLTHTHPSLSLPLSVCL